MRKAVALIAALLLVSTDGLLTAATPKKSTAQKKSSGKAARKGTAKKGATRKAAPSASSKKGRTSRSRKGRSAAKRQTWRNRQLQPTPARYQEIQQALVQKGYLKGTVTGTWDQASADAMRSFQQDQNLEPSGKIDSLSLIALGLGPKHENTASAAPPGSERRP